MLIPRIVLLVLSVICFALKFFNVPASVDWMAGGFGFAVASFLLPA